MASPHCAHLVSAAMKGVLADHLLLPAAAIESSVLPGSAVVRKLSLLA